MADEIMPNGNATNGRREMLGGRQMVNVNSVDLNRVFELQEEDIASVQAKFDDLHQAVARLTEVFVRIGELDAASTTLKRRIAAKLDAIQNIGRMAATEFLGHRRGIEKAEELLGQINEERIGLVSEMRILTQKIVNYMGGAKCIISVGGYDVEFQPEWNSVRIVPPNKEAFRVSL
jgi:hypothetical protein